MGVKQEENWGQMKGRFQLIFRKRGGSRERQEGPCSLGVSTMWMAGREGRQAGVGDKVACS